MANKGRNWQSVSTLDMKGVEGNVPSPLATMKEMLICSIEVKKVIAFSKKWLATCMTPEAC